MITTFLGIFVASKISSSKQYVQTQPDLTLTTRKQLDRQSDKHCLILRLPTSLEFKMCEFTSTGYLCRECSYLVKMPYNEEKCDHVLQKKPGVCQYITRHDTVYVHEDECPKCREKKKGKNVVK